LIVFFQLSCKVQNNCETLKINNSIENISYRFYSTVEIPYLMSVHRKYQFNDTVIIDNQKIPKLDTIYPSFSTDFYGAKDGISFSFDRYKATDVDIEVTRCYY